MKKNQFIRSLMTLKGISQYDLGARIHRPQPWVSQWLNGWIKPTEKDVERISEVLEVGKDLIRQ